MQELDGVLALFSYLRKAKHLTMKKILAGVTLIAFLSLGTSAFAQDDSSKSTAGKAAHSVKKGAKKAWSGTKKGAKAVGNETAETATKVKAKVTDKEYEGWVAPNGHTVYVDDGSKYYWINESGKRVFVKKDQLRAKQ